MRLSTFSAKIGRAVSFFLLAAMTTALLCGLPVCALEDPAVENIRGAYLYNIENNQIVYERNIHESVYPASTVKIMTALVAEERLAGRLAETVTVTAQMLNGVTGNHVGLKAGEQISIENLFYALLVRGANDAAHVLACLCAGSVDAFVALMNQKAAELGAGDTIYKNPSGMHHDEMVTTVADTAKIALAAYQSPFIMAVSSTAKHVIPATNLSEQRTIFNRNYLIAKNEEVKYYLASARGLNAGSTQEGGYCLVSTAQKDGLTYLCVVMGGESDESNNYAFAAGKALFTWAFNSFGYVNVIDPSKRICEIPVTLSTEADFVSLVPRDSLTVYLPLDINLEEDLHYSWKVTYSVLNAPVYEGQEAGYLTVSYGERMLGSVPLVTTNGVTRSDFKYALHQIEAFTRSRFFLAAVVSGGCFTVLYVFIKAVYRARKSNKLRSRLR